MSGHNKIAGNCKVHELAREGALTPISFDWKHAGCPMAYLSLDLWSSNELDRKMFSELLALSKVSLAAIVEVLTGHWPICTHAVRLVNILSDAPCSSCHLLPYCPAISKLKLRYLGGYTFREPSEVAGIDINRLNKFRGKLKTLRRSMR